MEMSAMTKDLYVVLAPIKLRDGVDETMLIAASDVFETDFVSKQTGIVKRLLLRSSHGGYADLVFFESKADAERVAETEATSAACANFFSIMETPNESTAEMEALSFEHVKTYEQRPAASRPHG
jgi:hypothetical protein